MAILTIGLSLEPRERYWGPPPEEIVPLLRGVGYDEIDLMGLEALGARLRSGRPIDLIPLRIEDDAEFLTRGALDVEIWAGNPRSSEHNTYLLDGSFEISALPVDDNYVDVWVGEFPSACERLESAGPIRLQRWEYVYAWRSIASGLLKGLSR